MSKQYDNALSGALFATGDKSILSGPFQFTNKDESHVQVMVLGSDGVHTCNVHKRGKEGQAVGKALLTIEYARTNGGENAAGNKRPIARSRKVTGPKADESMRFCIWQASSDKVGDFYQTKPDSFEPRELPAL